MTTEEKMTIDERRKYLKVMKKRYSKAGRKERGQLFEVHPFDWTLFKEY